MTRDGLLLGLSYVATTGHSHGWTETAHDVDQETSGYWRVIGREADAAGLHFVLLGHGLSGVERRGSAWQPNPDPVPTLGLLAGATERVGLVGTASAIYNDPYLLAKQYLSLDHLSGGRAGWNLVTSFYEGAARAFQTGGDLPHAERYEAADEFLRIVLRLWDAWAPDAKPKDAATGRFVAPERIAEVDERGRYFRVGEPLPLSRSPQGRPVVVQPVSSAQGQRFAARNADVVFTSLADVDVARDFRDALRRHQREEGRERADVAITPGVVVLLGDTTADARAQFERLNRWVDESAARRAVLDLTGEDASLWDRRDALVADALPRDPAGSREGRVVRSARSRGLTVGQLAAEVAATRGHLFLVGSAADVADELERWHVSGTVDGFVLGPAVSPDGVERIARELVPELRRRGLVHAAPRSGDTLAQSLGIVPPGGVLSSAPAVAPAAATA